VHVTGVREHAVEVLNASPLSVRPARPPDPTTFTGWAFSSQLVTSMMWQFCSTMMSPDSTLSWTQLRSRTSAGVALGHSGRFSADAK
jgi:hypothetical protein